MDREWKIMIIKSRLRNEIGQELLTPKEAQEAAERQLDETRPNWRESNG